MWDKYLNFNVQNGRCTKGGYREVRTGHLLWSGLVPMLAPCCDAVPTLWSENLYYFTEKQTEAQNSNTNLSGSYVANVQKPGFGLTSSWLQACVCLFPPSHTLALSGLRTGQGRWGADMTQVLQDPWETRLNAPVLSPSMLISNTL